MNTRSVLALLSALWLWMAIAPGCRSRTSQSGVEAASAPADPAEVRVARAESRRVARSISVTGSLAADETVTVTNEVAGRLEVIRVDFGQRVRAGEVIAELDRRELQLQLDRARASLAQALARVGLAPGQEEVIPQTTPTIRQAQAMLEDARTRYESAAKLVQTGDIAADRFVEIEKAYRAREASLDAARHELETSLAAIRALRAEVRLAEKRLADATVRAPMDGYIAERMASPGQYLRENTPIVTLVKPHPLRLRVEVPESASAAVRVGTELRFTTDAIPGAEFGAVVRQLNPALDPRSRSLTAEARLTASDERLRPGMFVQVKLVIERAVEVVVVPREAVYSVAGLNKVFLVRDGRAVERRVRLGTGFDGWVEVRDGAVSPGELVALSRLGELVDGAAVRPEQSPPAGG
jgi:RND family efflux transporter MFP subunit